MQNLPSLAPFGDGAFKDADAIMEIAVSALDGLAMGVLFCDRAGKISYVNNIYAELLNLAPADILGLNIRDFFPDEDVGEILSGASLQIEGICELTSQHSVIARLMPARDRFGRVIGLISHAIFEEAEAAPQLAARLHRLGRMLLHARRRFHVSNAPCHTFDSIVSKCESMHRLIRKARCYSLLAEPVLILGPTGTIKSVFAQAIHNESGCAKGPFLYLDCSLKNRERLERELFGSEKGLFGKPWFGKIDLAAGGSLYLHEISYLPLDLQARLMASLDAPANGDCRFRLIASSGRDIRSLLKTGAFREDLYYRLESLKLEIPPLSENREDIPLIARHILDHTGYKDTVFSPEAERAMYVFCWPGNARQLREAVIFAADHCKGGIITPGDFPADTLCAPCPGCQAGKGLACVAAETEAQVIYRTLGACNSNVAATARKLKISRATLYEKMRRYKINPRKS